MKNACATLLLSVVSAVVLAGQSDRPPPEATEVWTPVPPVVVAPVGAPPSDAIVVFDGSGLDGWEAAKNPGQPAPWRIEAGAMVCVPGSGNIRTRRSFGDIQLHLEYRIPSDVAGEGQGRGNSGVMIMGRYEVQILESQGGSTYVNGQAASIYKQHAPLVNACRVPGEWQTYDIVWIAPRFGADGQVRSPARITVLHNGVLVHHDAVLRGSTAFRGAPSYARHAAELPLEIQDHKNPVAFRNIWVRELHLPAAP